MDKGLKVMPLMQKKKAQTHDLKYLSQVNKKI